MVAEGSTPSLRCRHHVVRHRTTGAVDRFPMKRWKRPLAFCRRPEALLNERYPARVDRHLGCDGPRLRGVAGVLVSDEAQLIIASNRAENTIGVFRPGPDPQVSKISVGVRPNGLAYDHVKGQILVANVGDPAMVGSHTLSMVAINEEARAEIKHRGGLPARSTG